MLTYARAQQALRGKQRQLCVISHGARSAVNWCELLNASSAEALADLLQGLELDGGA